MSLAKKHSALILILIIFVSGAFLRLYKIDFGRPQSFLYDETDIYDDVIKYAQNYKFIMEKDGLMGFQPSSYVYGMFPTYFLIFSTMILNKTVSIFHLPIDFDFYFVYMRIVTAVFSLLAVIFTGLLYRKVFKNKIGTLISLALVVLNWKLIANSHYLNHDTYLTIFTISCLYFFISYLYNDSSKKYWHLFISACLLGLAAGTKVTGLLIAPLIGVILLLKKDWKGVFLYIAGVILIFAISNPFFIINFSEFFSRLVKMRTTEAGVVFGDINNNPLRYPFSLFKMLTPLVFLLSIFGIYNYAKPAFSKIKNQKFDNETLVHTLLISTILIYILFYSLTPRMIERWMLPIIPILIIYSTEGILKILEHIKNHKFINTIIIASIFITVIIFPISLIKQLNMEKPRVSAYKWVSNYLKQEGKSNYKVLMYTNKGYRDPFSKIENCDMDKFEVYESKGAQNSYPKDPMEYNIVVLYSYMERNYENKYVLEKYPKYYRAWDSFNSTVKDPERFKLVGSFETTKLDLLGIPEIFVYERIE